jgi:hypothetical protein
MSRRTRARAGKKTITICLSEKEYDLLIGVSEKECRSVTMQATYMILEKLRQFTPETQAALDAHNAHNWEGLSFEAVRDDVD